MNFDDIKEKLKSEWQKTADKIQDNALFIRIKEKYENLSPRAQKITVLGLATLAVLSLASFPLGYYGQSESTLEEFTASRDLLRDLFKAQREISMTPKPAMPPDLSAIQAEIENKITVMKLLPEQNRGSHNPQDLNSFTTLIAGNLLKGGLVFEFSKLNLRQIVDLGTTISRISPSVKMTGMEITESEPTNPKMKGYFNVIYRLAALAVPEETPVVPEEPNPKQKAQRNRPGTPPSANSPSNSPSTPPSSKEDF